MHAKGVVLRVTEVAALGGCLVFGWWAWGRRVPSPGTEGAPLPRAKALIPAAPQLQAEREQSDNSQKGSVTIGASSPLAKRAIGIAIQGGKLTDTVCEFLKIMPEERLEVEKQISRSVARLKELESENCRKETTDNGDEILKVAPFWTSGGAVQFQTLREELSKILGQERSDWLMMGVGMSALDVGDFGYYERHLFISDSVVDDAGNRATTISVRPVDPAAAVARHPRNPQEMKLLQAERKKVMEARASAPVSLVGITARVETGNEGIVQRYAHLFEHAR
jgi:hypothetical protein